MPRTQALGLSVPGSRRDAVGPAAYLTRRRVSQRASLLDLPLEQAAADRKGCEGRAGGSSLTSDVHSRAQLPAAGGRRLRHSRGQACSTLAGRRACSSPDVCMGCRSPASTRLDQRIRQAALAVHADAAARLACRLSHLPLSLAASGGGERRGGLLSADGCVLSGASWCVLLPIRQARSAWRVRGECVRERLAARAFCSLCSWLAAAQMVGRACRRRQGKTNEDGEAAGWKRPGGAPSSGGGGDGHNACDGRWARFASRLPQSPLLLSADWGPLMCRHSHRGACSQMDREGKSTQGVERARGGSIGSLCAPAAAAVVCAVLQLLLPEGLERAKAARTYQRG